MHDIITIRGDIMSSFEYTDMFIESQDKGKYHMFVFDIVGSKKLDFETRRKSQIQMEELMNKIYNEIKQIEDLSQTKILVMDIDGIVTYEEQQKVMYKFGMLFEPWIFGDTFGFTIYRDSLPKEIILTIYEKYNLCNFNITSFHLW